jgi:hypothetical protein
LIFDRSMVLGGREKPLWANKRALKAVSIVGCHQACVKHLLLREGHLRDG